MDSANKTYRGLIGWQRKQLTMPRVQMSLIILVSGLGGFLAAFVLLRFGITQMWLRYPAAIVVGYLVFLLLLRIWIYIHSDRGERTALENIDIPINPDIPDLGGGGFEFGGGGDFSGAGSGGSWSSTADTAGSSSGGDGILDGVSLDLDELVFVILAIAAIIGGLLAVLYVVYIAPAFLAEIFVDGVLLAALNRKLKNVEQRYWLETALKNTWIPLGLCIVFACIFGYAIQWLFPGAESIGEVFRAIKGN